MHAVTQYPLCGQFKTDTAVINRTEKILKLNAMAIIEGHQRRRWKPQFTSTTC